jgi:hypothetical protein
MAEIIGVDDISYCNDCYGRGHYTGDVPVGICLFPCPWVGDMTREMIQQATKTRCIHHRGNPRESRSHPYQSERDTCTASATFKRQSDCEDKTPSKGVCKDCHYFESERDASLISFDAIMGIHHELTNINNIASHIGDLLTPLNQCLDAHNQRIQKCERDKMLDGVERIAKTRSWIAMDAFLASLRQAGEP